MLIRQLCSGPGVRGQPVFFHPGVRKPHTKAEQLSAGVFVQTSSRCNVIITSASVTVILVSLLGHTDTKRKKLCLKEAETKKKRAPRLFPRFGGLGSFF